MVKIVAQPLYRGRKDFQRVHREEYMTLYVLFFATARPESLGLSRR